ncbi:MULTISPECIES: PAS domain-containing protein [unclassified Guyparkeria]|uniref:PAS domain-containing protein n=1 Tax=unclassified Guyparkeria TaxID=2626246 RepID=UPI0007336CE4|nr:MULTISPECIES: PAS domain-containing protein [unclassified Guyparkeria]KTG17576.1 hypothetical protein AUR63_07950 [Guyparkeria sp. XI15]OAE88389.1 hypothetical protein AWR35_07965 [Guyparkeria sp. WRN-7]
MRPALPITVAYLLLASLWIWATQWLLGRLGGAHWEISTAGLVFGEIFVLVTGALLYVLVDRLHVARTGQLDFGYGRVRGSQTWLTAMVIALVVIAAAQIFITVIAARQYAPLLLDKAQREVGNLAAIRAIEVDNWVDQRDQQVEALAQRREWLKAWISDLDEGRVEGFPDDLRRGGLVSRFQAITLLDPDRNPRLQTGSSTVVPPDMRHFDQAAVTTEVQTVTRFTRGRGGVDLFWILPVYDDRTAVSRGPWYLLFWTRLNTRALVDGAESQNRRVRADEALRILLIRVPSEPETASSFWPMLTLDPREESNQVGETPAPIVDRLQAGLSDSPDPEAAEGVTRIKGSDRVYATVALDRLQARLLVLQDRRAVLAPVEQMEKWLSLTAILSTLGTLAALFFLWRFLRGRYRLQTRNVVLERDFWHRAWLDMPALGLIEIDPLRLNVVAANRQAANWLGRARDSLVGSSLFELFRPTDPASPLSGDPEAALPAYFARGAVDRVAIEGCVPDLPAAGPMWLELRVQRDAEGNPERMIGMLRPARETDNSAVMAQVDHLAAFCASLTAAERARMQDRLADHDASPFLEVLPVTVDISEVHDREALRRRIERCLPPALRRHRALLRALAEELGRVLVSGEGRWVHSDNEPADPGLENEGSPVVINAAGHSVVILPARTGTQAAGEVTAWLYISRDRWEMTPELLEAIERLHAICQ